MNKPYSLMREKFVSTELRNPPEAVFVQDAADSEMKIDKETAERVLNACGYEFDFSCPRCAELEKALVMAESALETLAKLGNGDCYGNSHGNTIAQEALTVT